MKTAVTIVVLALCTFGSAVELVLNRHEARTLFGELQDLRNSQQELDQEWGQLLLEQATWATHVRVEDMARGSLGMVTPPSGEIVEIR